MRFWRGSGALFCRGCGARRRRFWRGSGRRFRSQVAEQGLEQIPEWFRSKRSRWERRRVPNLGLQLRASSVGRARSFGAQDSAPRSSGPERPEPGLRALSFVRAPSLEPETLESVYQTWQRARNFCSRISSKLQDRARSSPSLGPGISGPEPRASSVGPEAFGCQAWKYIARLGARASGPEPRAPRASGAEPRAEQLPRLASEFRGFEPRA